LILTFPHTGRGLPPARHECGRRNGRRRATELGGAGRSLPVEPHGTRMEWTVPLQSAGTTSTGQLA
jgi:hypothetical protein